jgi:hypothetical protein
MPSFFQVLYFSNNEVYMHDSYIFCNYEDPYQQRLCYVQYTFAIVE